MVKIAVIGGGVMGLGSAVAIQEKCPGVDITLISEKFSPNTTGDGAAGIWGPYLLGQTSPELIKEWARTTHNLFLELWKSQNAGEMGITLIPAYYIDDNENSPEPFWKDIVFGFRKMTEKELERIDCPGKRYGFSYCTFTCEPRILLPKFLERFKNGGGKVLERRVTDLMDLQQHFDILVNCTGLGSHKLVSDERVFPVRGQVMRVSAPGIFYALLDVSDDGDGYIIPNQNSIVLGGTHQEGDWNLNVETKDVSTIKEYCHQIFPFLKESKVLQNWVGLRPARSMVRLEVEKLNTGGKPFTIIHNYGHAGSGVTLFWGCAQNVTSLVQQAILASNSKL